MFHKWYVALALHFLISVACTYNMRETKVCCGQLQSLSATEHDVCEDVG